QDEIVGAVFKTTGKRVSLIGAGRTDAGVHALGQVANFHITHDLEPARYREALNYYLPDDIRIWDAVESHPEFHARYDARFRRYRYLIGEAASALYRHQRWHQPGLDLSELREAAKHIVGEHDFSAFCVVSSRKEDNRCRIDHSQWRQIGPLLVYEIRGNRFLHSMVRSLVGAMANLARREQDRNPRNLTLGRFKDILIAPGEERNVFTAPAHGLYLVSVGY
ncbi:MAG: tRNA pseudouridine(38-40) synthase TruA, partial [Candidatus Zixiibacteriota bacterium]